MKKLNFKKTVCSVVASVLFGTSMVASVVAAPKAPTHKAGDEYDVVLAYSKSTSLTWIKDDSWEKKITVTGYKNSGYDQYETVTVGFDDGTFSDTDYMYTGVKVLTKYKADVATFVWVAGKIENGSKSSSWSSYVTNGGTCSKISVGHSGTAKYYVAFAG